MGRGDPCEHSKVERVPQILGAVVASPVIVLKKNNFVGWMLIYWLGPSMKKEARICIRGKKQAKKTEKVERQGTVLD